MARRVVFFLFLLLVVGGVVLNLRWPSRWKAYPQSPPALLTGDLFATYTFNTLKHPSGLAVSFALGNLDIYIADTSNHVIRKFSGGTLSLLAGTGARGYVDGPLSSAQFNFPTGLQGGTYMWTEQVVDPNCIDPLVRTCVQTIRHSYTLLYVTDTDNYVVRMVCSGDPPDTGPCNTTNVDTVSTVAGNHIKGFLDGPSTSAEFGRLGAISQSSSFFICDAENHSVRSWDRANVMTYAGTGSPGLVNGYRTSAQFNCPTQVTWDPNGNVYVADAGNNVIRKIDTAGNVSTFAGSGMPGYADGPGTSARFHMPCAIVFNPADNFLYVADTQNNVIRRIDLASNVSTYAGASGGGLADGSLTQARFTCPMGIVIFSGVMYVSDTMNNAIRRIDMASGTVST